MASQITLYMEQVTSFLEERELQVSPEKSTTTLFTPCTHEFNLEPDVNIKGEKIKLEHTPKLLGIAFDTMFCFGQHVNSAAQKAKTNLNILKQLAGSKWGQDKQTLINTYKSICRSTLEYGALIWAPNAKDTHWQKLQSVQNSALRVATGCLQMTSIAHLHQEKKVLPVKEHSLMLTQQFAAACHQPGHPGRKNCNITRPRPGRFKKKTVMNHLYPTVKSLLHSSPSSKQHKQSLKIIHTRAVQSVINSHDPNRVLDTRPPSISKSEENLPRETKVELARLRSGFSRNLNSYLHRLDPSVSENCLDCGNGPHDTRHLFNCRAKPTTLTPVDLWQKSTAVAAFPGLPPPPGRPAGPAIDGREYELPQQQQRPGE